MVEIAVLLKQVPDTNAKIAVVGGRVDESAVTSWVTSPYDEYALEAALQHVEAAGGHTGQLWKPVRRVGSSNSPERDISSLGAMGPGPGGFPALFA